MEHFLLETKGRGGRIGLFYCQYSLFVSNSHNTAHKSIITVVESFNKPFYTKSSLFFKDDYVSAANIVDFPSGAVVTAPGDGGNQILQHYHGGLSRDIQNRSFLYKQRLNMHGVKSPKFNWAPVYICAHWLRPKTSPPPTHLGSYKRTLLVSQDGRHLFVTLPPHIIFPVFEVLLVTLYF
jgi:hypothetical protein